MSAEYDLLIAGAGPGGSNAAAVALRAGLRVAQIDRCVFPRVKPCGGGITIKASDALQLDLRPSLILEAREVEFNVWDRRANRFSHQAALLRMVFRPDLDSSLIEQNRGCANFTLFEGERAMEIGYDGRFHVRTDRRCITAPQLVGADGAYSLVNRIVRVAAPRAMATAVEVELDRTVARPRRPLVPCFDIRLIEQGYGWVFPKGDHWNVGLFTYARGLKDLRGQLAEYIRAKGFELRDDPLLTFCAHRIPVGGFRLAIPAMPLYLVGDAGGFADALTGEGIYFALESGRLAGATACRVSRGEGTHRRYYRQLWRTVLPDTLLTYYASTLFYRHPSAGVGLLAQPLVWRTLIQGYGDGATFAGTIGRGGYYLVRSLLAGALRHERRSCEEGAL